MKNLLKYAGICAAVLALIAFILVIACNAMKADFGFGTDKVKGMDAIFAKGDCKHMDKALAGVFGFIFLIVAIIILVLGFVLPLVGKNMDAKIAGVLNIVAAVLLILAGILIICTKNSWIDANYGDDLTKSQIKELKKNIDLTAEYAIAGVLAIIAGLVALAPAAADFMDKK